MHLQFQCATLVLTLAASAAAVPTGTSGQLVARSSPSPGTFLSIQCTIPEVTNAATPPSDRWAATDAGTAWVDVIANWEVLGITSGLTFVESVSNNFHGPEQMQCGVTAANNGCNGADIECNAVNCPAGYLMLNSLKAVSEIHNNMFNAVQTARSQIVGTISDFTSTFAPIVDDSMAQKIILDVFGLVWSLSMAPIWNIVLRNSPAFKGLPNELGAIKDSTNALVTSGIGIVKDATVAGSTLTNTNLLEKYVDGMMSAWANAISQINSDLFNGSATSLSDLGNLIQNGNMIEANILVDATVTQKAIEKALYAQLLPVAWPLSNQGPPSPFVLDSGFPCGAINPVRQYVSDDVAGHTAGCYNNNLYYLLNIDPNEVNCDGSSAMCRPMTTFPMLPGTPSMDGTNWGGLTVNDLISGAVASYNANGNQNGWAAADPTALAGNDALYGDQGLQIPGIVNGIPVCTGDVAMYNWGLYSPANPPAHFPCNPVPPGQL